MADDKTGMGYRNIFLAVAKRDETKIKELIENIKFVEFVRETDFFWTKHLAFLLELGDWSPALA